MTEAFLLDWLAKEDWSAYWECCGTVLDSLLEKGLVRLSEPNPSSRTGVALTEAGWLAVKAAQQ